MQDVTDEAPPVLIRRLRIALLLCFAPVLLFALADQSLGRDHLLALHGLKLVSVAAIVAALSALRGVRTRRQVVAVALSAAAAMYASTVTSAIITHEPLTTPLICICVALGGAILLPWGVWPQVGLTTLSAVAMAVVVRFASSDSVSLATYPDIGVAIGLGLSVYVAAELERSRKELARRHKEQQRAEAEVRQLNQELEGRVLERTAELSRLNGELQEQVAERTRAEAQRRQSDAALGALIDNVTDAMWSVDGTYRITACNWACAEHLPALIGAPIETPLVSSNRVAVPWPEAWIAHFDRALAGERFEIEHDVATGAATTSYMTSFNPIVADGAATGVAVFSIDITERKRREAEARHHQAELTHVLRLGTMGEMAAGLAHEINQPLGAIANYAQGCSRHLRAGTLSVGAVLTIVEDISEEALRAGEIIRRLRKLIRKETPRQDPFDLNDMVRDALHLLDSEVQEHGITVRVSAADGLPEVLGDGIQIEQVLLNLARNGIEAMSGMPSPRRQLSISTQQIDAGTVECVVQDHGPGLPADSVARVFEPFFTTKPGGLGMGLSISRTIIEAHHGHLRATTNPDGGMTFRFTLPTTTETDTTELAQRFAARSPRGSSSPAPRS